MNEESSRSHSTFTVMVESKRTKGVTSVKKGRIHLVDLAGSERQKLANTDGDRLKEAGCINQSLLTLKSVIKALVDLNNGKNVTHIPYRNSKLTFLLKDSLGGNSKTTIVACVTPA